MSLEDFYYVSQIIASVAVLASLIYLAIQTRQAARNQQAQMHAMRLQAIREDIRRMADPAFQHTYQSGMAADTQLQPAELGSFLVFVYGLMLNFQEQFHEFQEGMINARRWEPSKLALRRQLTMPGFRAAISTFRAELDAQFVALVDQLLAELKTAPAMQSTYLSWKQHAEEERAAASANT
jgi:hypothetical protein